MEKRFTLKPLPYAYDALEPFIDERTVMIHHDKHQQTYVDNLNKALEKYPQFFNYSLEEILKNLDEIPEDIKQAVTNNAGGVYNHEFYWDGMGPNKGGVPKGELKRAIDATFGSYANFVAQLKKASLDRFGSGWGWLVLNENNRLEITSTLNQNNPMSSGQTPLLAIDVWEHAYYLKYQNRRADYVTNIFNLIDWDVITDRFNRSK